MAYLQIIGMKEAEGDLLAAYAAMAARGRPSVYQPSHGDAAGIIRAHSLDPTLLRLAFAASGSFNGDSLSWSTQELVNSATSRENECFY